VPVLKWVEDMREKNVNSKWFLPIAIVIILLSVVGIATLPRGLPLRVEVRRELGQMKGPLQFALMDDASLEEIKRIVEKDPRTLDVVDPLLGTAMDRALVHDRVDVVEFLLESGWDPDRPVVTTETRECNPLGYAIRYGQVRIAQLLLEHGANPATASWDGKPARELCREYLSGAEQKECLELLEKSNRADSLKKRRGQD